MIDWYSQFALAPRSLLLSSVSVLGHPGENVGLQGTNGVPQGPAVSHPREIAIKVLRVGNAVPHVSLRKLPGTLTVTQSLDTSIKITQYSIQVAEYRISSFRKRQIRSDKEPCQGRLFLPFGIGRD